MFPIQLDEDSSFSGIPSFQLFNDMNTTEIDLKNTFKDELIGTYHIINDPASNKSFIQTKSTCLSHEELSMAMTDLSKLKAIRSQHVFKPVDFMYKHVSQNFKRNSYEIKVKYNLFQYNLNNVPFRESPMGVLGVTLITRAFVFNLLKNMIDCLCDLEKEGLQFVEMTKAHILMTENHTFQLLIQAPATKTFQNVKELLFSKRLNHSHKRPIYFSPELFTNLFLNNHSIDSSKANSFALALICLEFMIGCSVQDIFNWEIMKFNIDVLTRHTSKLDLIAENEPFIVDVLKSMLTLSAQNRPTLQTLRSKFSPIANYHDLSQKNGTHARTTYSPDVHTSMNTINKCLPQKVAETDQFSPNCFAHNQDEFLSTSIKKCELSKNSQTIMMRCNSPMAINPSKMTFAKLDGFDEHFLLSKSSENKKNQTLNQKQMISSFFKEVQNCTTKQPKTDDFFKYEYNTTPMQFAQTERHVFIKEFHTPFDSTRRLISPISHNQTVNSRPESHWFFEPKIIQIEQKNTPTFEKQFEGNQNQLPVSQFCHKTEQLVTCTDNQGTLKCNLPKIEGRTLLPQGCNPPYSSDRVICAHPSSRSENTSPVRTYKTEGSSSRFVNWPSTQVNYPLNTKETSRKTSLCNTQTMQSHSQNTLFINRVHSPVKFTQGQSKSSPTSPQISPSQSPVRFLGHSSRNVVYSPSPNPSFEEHIPNQQYEILRDEEFTGKVVVREGKVTKEVKQTFDVKQADRNKNIRRIKNVFVGEDYRLKECKVSNVCLNNIRPLGVSNNNHQRSNRSISPFVGVEQRENSSNVSKR
jgi:hypothetical protein